jgi:CRISPR-associated protein Csx17
MSLHVHHLTGCAPTPLAWYLKGLGLLRLVSGQKDPTARGWWQNESFHLATVLDQDALTKFLLEEYSPTPIMDPWNGGSGFYPKDTKDGFAAIERSTAKRLKAYSGALALAKSVVGDRKESPKDDEKQTMLVALRQQLRGEQLEAMNAAIVLRGSGRPDYPSLLGTGWNDGRLDFSNNFMQRLAELFDCSSPDGGPTALARDLLPNALYGSPAAGLQKKKAIGQFLPGSAGGANCTTGADGDSLVNPWDFVLMLEGAILFTASVVRRAALDAATSAAAPFALRGTPSGYASASPQESDARGEQWMPLWEQPCTLDDLRRLLSDGRAQLGSSAASRPVDFARAIARLGVARGITAFQRFGYIVRNGQANLATPLGRWFVASQPRQELLDDLTRWLQSLQRVARGDAPTSFKTNCQRLEEAILAACGSGDQAMRWQAVLLTMANIEYDMASASGFTAANHLQPIPRLRTDWIEAADDGSPEFRLALALAMQSADGGLQDPVRSHWLPLDEKGHFAVDKYGLRKDPRVVCHGLEPERSLIALVQRRLTEGGKGALNRAPLMAAKGCAADLLDISAFLSGSLDTGRLLTLARALMALDRWNFGKTVWSLSHPQAGSEPPVLYALFRLTCLPWPLKRGASTVAIRCDPAIIARLAAGDLASAGDIALRRLRSSGFAPVLRHVAGDDASLAQRLAASLAFPISMSTACRLADRLIKP